MASAAPFGFTQVAVQTAAKLSQTCDASSATCTYNQFNQQRSSIDVSGLNADFYCADITINSSSQTSNINGCCAYQALASSVVQHAQGHMNEPNVRAFFADLVTQPDASPDDVTKQLAVRLAETCGSSKNYDNVWLDNIGSAMGTGIQCSTFRAGCIDSTNSVACALNLIAVTERDAGLIEPDPTSDNTSIGGILGWLHTLQWYHGVVAACVMLLLVGCIVMIVRDTGAAYTLPLRPQPLFDEFRARRMPKPKSPPELKPKPTSPSSSSSSSSSSTPKTFT